MTVPGIGPIISTATVAAIGSGEAFPKGRDFGAWLGLVPRQMSTGGRTVLGPISKRGNRYLRMLFVQAARAVLLGPQSWEKHGLKSWIEAPARRLNRFQLAIALANKIARIAWGVLHGGRNFEAKSMKPRVQAVSRWLQKLRPGVALEEAEVEVPKPGPGEDSGRVVMRLHRSLPCAWSKSEGWRGMCALRRFFVSGAGNPAQLQLIKNWDVAVTVTEKI
jgi:hypothetical protein